jgi:hypothetical protein
MEITHLIDSKITEILQELRDNNFGSKDQRQIFVKLIAALAVSNDPRAKKTIKKLGDIFTEIGDELLRESKQDTYKIQRRIKD